MDEKFTDRARTVMSLAEEAGRRMQNDYLGTEHILLGLLEEGHGVAGNVLKHSGVDVLRLTEVISGITSQRAAETPEGDLPRTPRARQAIEFARDEAQVLRHYYVGTEHLLLGLMRITEGVAVQAVLKLGIKPNELRREVYSILGHLDLAEAEDV